MATVETHTETSQILIRQAEAELQDGDRLQASEKGWGAAAHALKAVAEQRGWRHNSHGLLIGVADTLAGETGAAQKSAGCSTWQPHCTQISTRPG